MAANYWGIAKAVRMQAGVSPYRAADGLSRLLPLDAVRGLIIMLMALDHANYFVAQRHPIGEHWGGRFPSYDSAVAFLTRFVTHLSAPGFFLLLGVGVVLFAIRRLNQGWSYSQIRRHFVLRGALLIALQFTVINPIWKISPIPFPRWYQGVLVALGGTMILASLLLRQRSKHLFLLAFLLALGTELSHPDPSQWGLIFEKPLGLVFLYSGGDGQFWVNYPIIPWLELVVLGMAIGHWLNQRGDQAYWPIGLLGAMMLLGFLPLRFLDGFGNIRPMADGSWIGFLNLVKYPPSLTFTLLTTGVNLLLLALFHWLESQMNWLVGTLAVYGRVPLFLYITHLLLFALLGRWLTPTGSGFGVMYVIWLVGLAALFPLAKVYATLKRRSKFKPILRYL